MDENKYLNSLFQEFLQQKKIKIDADKKWLQEIKKTAGVYLIRMNGEMTTQESCDTFTVTMLQVSRLS